MPTTYAAYSNLHAPNMASAASSTPTSRRNSISSETSTDLPKKSRWHRFLDEFKPIEKPLPPVGFFTPIPQYPAKQQKKSSATGTKAEDTPSRRASKAFENFKSVAGERHSVYVRG